MSVEFDSRTLNRKTLNRWTARILYYFKRDLRRGVIVIVIEIVINIIIIIILIIIMIMIIIRPGPPRRSRRGASRPQAPHRYTYVIYMCIYIYTYVSI